jgi:hypothetical protein
MRTLRVLFALAVTTTTVISQASQFFDVVKVADGVYGAIGKPGILSNAAVIRTGTVITLRATRPIKPRFR